MKTKPKVGPIHHTAFFDDIKAVFDRHPDVAMNYSIHYIGGLVEVMKVDFGRQVAVSNVQGNEIVTRFVDRAIDPTDPIDPIPDITTDPGCCQWKLSGHEWRCVFLCTLPPPG